MVLEKNKAVRSNTIMITVTNLLVMRRSNLTLVFLSSLSIVRKFKNQQKIFQKLALTCDIK